MLTALDFRACLKLKYEEAFSNFAFNFNLRHYMMDRDVTPPPPPPAVAVSGGGRTAAAALLLAALIPPIALTLM